MKLFTCQHCGNLLYFENTACEKCAHVTGYLPDLGTLSAVEADGPVWIALADAERRYRFCANWESRACNWMVESVADAPEAVGPVFCAACSHNNTIPDVSDPVRHAQWVKIAWHLIMETVQRL